LTVGGPTLAAHVFNAELVDECQLFIYPVLVGEGKPAFPSDARIQLELLEEHRFANAHSAQRRSPRSPPARGSASRNGQGALDNRCPG
jgi:dihydrofolate reductase